jgi:redox-sensitive bicupin YhaK (pirin superfamily)
VTAPVDIDRIQHVPNPPRFDQWLDPRAPSASGAGYTVTVHCGAFGGIAHKTKGSTRTVLGIRIERERRVEIDVKPGERAFLIVLSGAGRIEGDDTPVKDNDVVWFKPVPGSDHGFLGLECDLDLEALYYSEQSIEATLARA